ncbi:MAG: hypothetical protein FWJ70_14910 [Micromonosporaceae bacterium]
MDVVVTYALALPTIFLAAFLAAAMENVRERARTRKWVMRNLRVLAATEQTGSPDLLRAALRRWLAAESPDEVPEETWRQAWFTGVWSLPDSRRWCAARRPPSCRRRCSRRCSGWMRTFRSSGRWRAT